MNFSEIAQRRQSCRNYNPEKSVEDDKLNRILEAARLAPSACNSQPYRITVCRGNAAKKVASAVQGMGINKFAPDVPLMLVISESAYSPSAAFGAKIKGNDYRSIDIGILSAHVTLEATALGLGSCILGWFDDEKIRQICDIDTPVRLVIAIGYAKDDDKLREKKRKDMDELVKYID